VQSSFNSICTYVIYANLFLVVDLNYFVGNISELSFYLLFILLLYLILEEILWVYFSLTLRRCLQTSECFSL